MSLIVYAYRRVAGKIVDLDVKPTPPRNNLAGFEAWRQTVYGSAAARTLGLQLIPSLGVGQDVYAEGEDLERLKAEAELLLANLAVLAGDADGIRFRVENILEAIRLAQDVADGGVYIG